MASGDVSMQALVWTMIEFVFCQYQHIGSSYATREVEGSARAGHLSSMLNRPEIRGTTPPQRENTVDQELSPDILVTGCRRDTYQRLTLGTICRIWIPLRRRERRVFIWRALA